MLPHPPLARPPLVGSSGLLGGDRTLLLGFGTCDGHATGAATRKQLARAWRKRGSVVVAEVPETITPGPDQTRLDQHHEDVGAVGGGEDCGFRKF